MSVRACMLVALAARVAVVAEPVCSSTVYGVLNGTAHHLPEHYLMPNMFDWAIGVPLLCPGQLVSGMEARVCSWLSAPSVRIVDWATALVRLAPWLPTYSSINVTVYCGPQPPAPAPSSTLPPPSNALTSSPLTPPASTEELSLNRLLGAKTLRHSLLTPLWSRS